MKIERIKGAGMTCRTMDKINKQTAMSKQKIIKIIVSVLIAALALTLILA